MPIARRLGEGVCLLDERRRCLRVARHEMDADAGGEGERQLRERPGLSGGPDVVSRERGPIPRSPR